MKITYGMVKFNIDKIVKFSDSEKLRGYIISLFSNNEAIHNHSENGKSIYKFPTVQYKIIDKKLSMVLFNEQINFLIEIYTKINSLNLEQKNYTVEKNIEIKDYDIKYLEDLYLNYEFISYYLPFNQYNYSKYLMGEYSLKNAIINNILEFLKGVNIILNKDQKLKINKIEILNHKVVQTKNIKFQGFKIRFSINIDLPDYISLGKRKSIGYGVIKKIKLWKF